MIIILGLPFLLGSTLNYHPETHTLYLFGGYNEGNFDAEMYRVEVDEWIWEKIYIQEQDLKPSGRYNYTDYASVSMMYIQT